MVKRMALPFSSKTCSPCEGSLKKCSSAEAQQKLQGLAGWQLSETGQQIHKTWTVKNFMAGMNFFHRVAELATAAGHHPNLSLQDGSRVSVELSTAAVGGLTERDFVLAAKIDRLPVEGQTVRKVA